MACFDWERGNRDEMSVLLRRNGSGGGLHGLPNDIVYWLPKNTGVHFMVLTRKRIEEYGGIILSNKMNAAYAGLTAFLAEEHPVSFCCKECRAILTKY